MESKGNRKQVRSNKDASKRGMFKKNCFELFLIVLDLKKKISKYFFSVVWPFGDRLCFIIRILY